MPSGLTSTERLLRLAALASREGSADPLDAAILDRLSEERLERPVVKFVATFPFTENRRRETAIVETEGEHLAVTKGSPETILGMADLAEEERKLWMQRIEELAAGGRKVIACASQSLPPGFSEGEPEQGYQLAGALVGRLSRGIRPESSGAGCGSRKTRLEWEPCFSRRSAFPRSPRS